MHTISNIRIAIWIYTEKTTLRMLSKNTKRKERISNPASMTIKYQSTEQISALKLLWIANDPIVSCDLLGSYFI